MIPISLIVTIELVKYLQVIFMDSDVEMYSKEKDKFVKVNSCSLNEELGQIKYIFSDKTGTLTSNKLEFKACAIGNEIYGCTDGFLNSDDNLNFLKRRVTHSIGGRGLKTEFSFPVSQIHKYSKQKENGASLDNVYLYSKNNLESLKISNQREIIEYFLYSLAINHSCFIDKVPTHNTESKSSNSFSLSNIVINDIDSKNSIEIEEISKIHYKVNLINIGGKS